MNSGCEEGLRLRRGFERALRGWGWFDACKRAVETLPVALQRVGEFQMQVKNAESELVKARSVYSDHMAHCLACSSGLVVPDAIETVRAKLKKVSEEFLGT